MLLSYEESLCVMCMIVMGMMCTIVMGMIPAWRRPAGVPKSLRLTEVLRKMNYRRVCIALRGKIFSPVILLFYWTTQITAYSNMKLVIPSSASKSRPSTKFWAVCQDIFYPKRRFYAGCRRGGPAALMDGTAQSLTARRRIRRKWYFRGWVFISR